MAYKEESKFIKLVKEFGIRDLSRFVGYEAEPPIMVSSGKKLSTAGLNPLALAMVAGRKDLYDFILKQVDFNLSALLRCTPYLSGET